MRSCLVLLLLLILLAANGYTIYQLRAMRNDLDDLREEIDVAGDPARRSMIDCARDAAEAVGQGQMDRAAEELRRLDGMLRETRQLAERQRRRAAEQLATARRAVAEGSERARDEVEKLVKALSSEEPEEAEQSG